MIGGTGSGGRSRPTAGRLCLALLVALALAGCGKKNAPVPPPDEPNTYPRAYPAQ